MFVKPVTEDSASFLSSQEMPGLKPGIQDRQEPHAPVEVPPAEMQAVLHDLRAHKIELDMQNEELRLAQDELAISNERYLNIYNEIPVGSVILNESGVIQEANLTACTLLGVVHGALAGQVLSSFIAKEDQDAYFLFRRQLVASTPSLCVELRMLHSDTEPRWVQVDGTVMSGSEGKFTLRCMLRDITRRRHLEASLQMKNLAFNAALSANSIANPEGIITEANAMFLRLWGFSCMEEVVGTPVTHFLKHPNEIATMLATLNEMSYWEGDYTAVRKDGSTFLANGLATTLCDCDGKIIGYQSSVIDVTEQRKARVMLNEWNTTLEARVAERTRELQDSEMRFRQLADSAFEGIAIANNGILIDGNRCFAEMHGYELAEMLGRPVSEFVAPQSRRSVSKSFSNSRPRNHEVLGLRKDGTVFPVETHMRIGPWLGHTVRIITLRDLTEANAAEARLHALRFDLVRAQRLALVSEVSAGIIHQLSQPLSCIGTNLAVWLKLKANELQQADMMEIFHDVEADVKRMRDIVTHLRAIANPEQVNRSSICLNALATEVLPLLKNRADHAQIRLELDLHKHLPTIHADAIQLSQVIFNLTRNAIEASANVPPEQRVVIITTRQHAERSIELCVRDNGCGLPAESVKHLFMPFFSTKSGGMGVGLRLCQTIVHAHDGQIEGFNNTDGPGATFRIELPVDPPPLKPPGLA